jgi:CBS domain containing-hemolysin-like protein
MVLSLVSNTVIPRLPLIFAILILACFIGLGIVFDVLGVSVATASDKPFHSMAARKVKGSAQAIRLLKNADKVSSFCNDVVGDISGIISGATAAVVVTRILDNSSPGSLWLQVLFSGIVSALTIGGKGIGKTLAIRYNVRIVSHMGEWIYYLEHFFRSFKRIHR